MKKTFTYLLMLAAIAVLFTTSVNAQTAGTLSFNVTTTFTGGSWANASNFVVWIENSSGTFIKTRIEYGGETDHLMQWAIKTPTYDVTDAITGATKTTSPFVYPAILWTGNDITGTTPYNLLPDGTYTVAMELAWGSSKVLGTGRQIFSKNFTKGTLSINIFIN